MIKTQPAVAGPMTKAQAREITGRIQSAGSELSLLIAEAHDRQAWKALGYANWTEYREKEFSFTKQRWHQLVDHGNALKQIAEASGQKSTAVDFSEATARAIKADMPAVTEDIKSRVAAGEKPKKAVDEAVKAARAAKQAANDAFRDENRAALPDVIKSANEIKQRLVDAGKIKEVTTFAEEQDPFDRIAELEEANDVLEKQNAVLAARIKQFSEMEAEYKLGGFDKVIEGRDAVIAALNSRVERESADKVAYMRSSDGWKKRAIDLGWSNDEVIDLKVAG